MNKLKTNQFYSIKIENQDETRRGYLISIGREWLLFLNVPVDYVIDGYFLVSRKSLHRWHRRASEKFVETIINKKIKKFKIKFPPLDLNSSEALFRQLSKVKKMIFISLADISVGYLGAIHKVEDSSCVLKLVSTRGKWINSKRYNLTNISLFELDTDYIISLGLVVK